jgi:hypothetical protein
MADWMSRTVTTVRKEYILPSPTNWVEAEKVFAAIRNELNDKRTYDDTVKIEARDDEIVFWFAVGDG